MTGVHVREAVGAFGGTPIVDQLAVRCTPIGGGMTVRTAFQGQPSFNPEIFVDRDCPEGKVAVGIRGRQGAVMDQIVVRCR